MQADSEKLRQAWIKAVQDSIATAFRENGDEPIVSVLEILTCFYVCETFTRDLQGENFLQTKHFVS